MHLRDTELRALIDRHGLCRDSLGARDFRSVFLAYKLLGVGSNECRSCGLLHLHGLGLHLFRLSLSLDRLSLCFDQSLLLQGGYFLFGAFELLFEFSDQDLVLALFFYDVNAPIINNFVVREAEVIDLLLHLVNELLVLECELSFSDGSGFLLGLELVEEFFLNFGASL